MKTIGNNVSRKLRIREHLRENSGITMTERSHGIKGMSGMPSTGGHGCARLPQVSVRVTQAHAHPARGRFRNHFGCTIQFRRDGHHLYMPVGGLPETFKRLKGRFQQIFLGMDSTPAVTEKRHLDVNSTRLSPRTSGTRVLFSYLDMLCQPLQGGKRDIYWSGHGRGHVAGYTMLRQQSLDGGQSLGRRFHYIVPRPSMIMDVQQSWGENGIAKIEQTAIFRSLTGDSRTEFDHLPAVD